MVVYEVRSDRELPNGWKSVTLTEKTAFLRYTKPANIFVYVDVDTSTCSKWCADVRLATVGALLIRRAPQNFSPASSNKC